jgi:hypothetical protein
MWDCVPFKFIKHSMSLNNSFADSSTSSATLAPLDVLNGMVSYGSPFSKSTDRFFHSIMECELNTVLG